jgi:pyruvate,water dikinase
MLGLGIVLVFNYLLMGVFNRRTADMPDDFMESFRGHVDRIVEDDRIDAPGALMHLFVKYRFFEPAGNMVMLVNLVAPRYMLFLRLISGFIERWAPDLPRDTGSLLCSGTEGVLSTEMGREILELANVARRNDVVRSLIHDQPSDKVMEQLEQVPEGSTFLKALEKFLAKHGHRALKEFELSSVRWEENPSTVIGMVRNYLLVDTEYQDTEASVRLQRGELASQLKAALAQRPLEGLGQPRWRLLGFLINQAKYYIKLRENSRFYHIMGFYAVRKKVLEIEQELLTRQVLKCKDDIFYLTWQEVQDLRDGKLVWLDVEDVIRGRRMEHIRLSKMMPPKTIGIDLEDIREEASDKLSGQGASPGRYEGIARVIMDPATDNEIEPGEILVAPYTDPAWTPMFLTANAAVIEVGSYLSHAGTIAREYGMPCVVDVANCTSKIKTGSRIVVDGSTGSVSILDEEQTS